MARELGDKLGPRLASLIRQHTIASRLALAPVEARIAAAGTQHVIDRAGRETAEHFAPMIAELLKHGDNLPDWLVEYLRETASGEHQWRSIAGVLGVSGATGAISTVLNNFLSPNVYELVRLSPGINLDQNTAAAAAAARIIPFDDGASTAAGFGYGLGPFQTLRDLAQLIPGAADLLDMHNRRDLDDSQLTEWLGRLALPPDLIAPVIASGRLLLTPADAALAVLREALTPGQGELIAALNGMTADDFATLVANTGEPPAIEELLMLWRRGKITTELLDRAIRQSRVRSEYIDVIHELSVEPPAQADVLEALVQGELTQAEALKRFTEAGGDPTYFDTAVRTRANAPAPGQLIELANRGIIPWRGTGAGAVSFQQGILEGRWKDKYLPAFQALAVYLPPPREIATLVKESGITQDQALALWKAHGMTPELAHAYWTAAHYQRTSAVHQLAIGEIEKLYYDQAITQGEALSMAEGIGWTKADATWLLDITDLRRERTYLERAISKISSLYVGRKIDRNAAASALAALEVPASQAEHLIRLWALEQADNVRVLTAAEIEDAWYYTIIDLATAQQLLVELGYTPYDAWLKLNIKNKGPIDNFPAPGAEAA